MAKQLWVKRSETRSEQRFLRWIFVSCYVVTVLYCLVRNESISTVLTCTSAIVTALCSVHAAGQYFGSSVDENPGAPD